MMVGRSWSALSVIHVTAISMRAVLLFRALNLEAMLGACLMLWLKMKAGLAVRRAGTDRHGIPTSCEPDEQNPGHLVA